MNKFKELLKNPKFKKTMRIILGILVITGIMTAMSFGIIAFIKAINKPSKDCDDDNDFYSTLVNKCVSKNCQDHSEYICKNGTNKGICALTGSDVEIYKNSFGDEYKFNNDKCVYELQCDDGYECLDPSGNKISDCSIPYNEIENQKDNFVCRKKCEYSSNVYINKLQKCSYRLNFDKDQNLFFLNVGWKSKNDESNCEKTSDGKMYCSDIFNKCSSMEEDFKSKHGDLSVILEDQQQNKIKLNQLPDDFNYYCYCQSTLCSDNNRVLCRISKNDPSNGKNSDCKDTNGSQGECIQTDSFFDLSKKGFIELGFCDNSSNIEDADCESKTSKYCVDLTTIGEKEWNGNSDEDIHNLVYQHSTQEYSNLLSLNQPQCNISDDHGNKTPFCNRRITNNWYCGSSDETNFTIPAYKNFSTDEPTFNFDNYSQGELHNYNKSCCGSDNIAKDQVYKGELYCCPGKVVSTKISGAEKLCMNGCNSPADPDYFGFSESELDCSIDENCKFLEDKINSKLPPYYQLTFDINSKNEDNFGKVFCNAKDNKCSFATGYVNTILNKKKYGDSGTNKYIIGEYSDSKGTTCAVTENDQKGSKFDFGTFDPTTDYETGSNLIGCKLKSGKELIWGFSNPTAAAIKASEYKTQKQFNLVGSNNKFDCLWESKNINDVYKTTGNAYNAINNGSGIYANSEDISLKGSKTCNITADCQNLEYIANVCKDSSCRDTEKMSVKWPIYTQQSVSEHKFPTHGFFDSKGNKQDIIFDLENYNLTLGNRNNSCYYNPQSFCETWTGTSGTAQNRIKQKASNIDVSSFENPCRYSQTTNGCYPNISANSNLVLNDDGMGKIESNKTYNINNGNLVKAPSP